MYMYVYINVFGKGNSILLVLFIFSGGTCRTEENNGKRRELGTITVFKVKDLLQKFIAMDALFMSIILNLK